MLLLQTECLDQRYEARIRAERVYAGIALQPDYLIILFLIRLLEQFYRPVLLPHGAIDQGDVIGRRIGVH